MCYARIFKFQMTNANIRSIFEVSTQKNARASRARSRERITAAKKHGREKKVQLDAVGTLAGIVRQNHLVGVGNAALPFGRRPRWTATYQRRSSGHARQVFDAMPERGPSAAPASVRATGSS